MASAANIAAFNVGNALGAWVGGLTIGAGLGYLSPLWAGAGITLVALVALLVATGIERRGQDGDGARKVQASARAAQVEVG